MKSAVCFFFALLSLSGWYIHEFQLKYGDHLALPPLFWSTVLLALFIALTIEGYIAWRRS
jgi:hypothetical protein